MKKILITFLMLFLVTSCKSHTDYIEQLIEGNGKYPEFSIQLKDMKEEGDKRYHKYMVHVGKAMDVTDPKKLTFSSNETKWLEVSPEQYDKYLPDLGMVIYSEKNGQANNVPQPAGYDKVGNAKYGEWRRDSSGNSFWAFYGQYMFFSNLMGGGRVYQNDYNTYRDYRSSNRPYYGTVTNGKSKYGTTGTTNKNSKFSQRVSKLNTNKRTSFQNRLSQAKSGTRTFKTRESGKSRVQRSRMNSVRSRSGRYGK